MGTSFLLLLVLITSILVTKYVSNKIDPPYVPPTEEQKQELARKAKAAAAAFAFLSAKGRDPKIDSEVKQ
jgi:hypothetical protein